jgi:NAD(P)-dependent dehydrogenase (short-subunit alcohol dehydrogenase family)
MTELTKVALITGASRGIGHASALALARKGFAVFLAAEASEAELSAAVATIGADGAAFGLFDLAVAGEAERMVAAALAQFGRIDVLVNNAGIRRRQPFGAFTRADFDEVVAVNLAAAFFASQSVLTAMRAQGGGRIINMASQMGSVAARTNALYGLTKAALIHLTRSMALELSGDNILVNSISPGPISTQFNIDRYKSEPGSREKMEALIPAGRFGTPEEVAEIVVFLATSEGRFMQGHDLVIDGGYIIH